MIESAMNLLYGPGLMRRPATLAEGLSAVTLRDGRTLAYRVLGEDLSRVRDRPAMVVLYFHGTPSCYLEALALEEDAAAAGMAVVAFDRPGIGSSSHDSRFSIPSVADDCVELLDALDLPVVSLVGVSGGGPYAAAFAALHPSRVRSLAMIAPVGSTKGNPALLKAMTGVDRLQFSFARLPVPTGGLWLLHNTLRYMTLRHPKALLEHMPDGMCEPDAAAVRGDERVRGALISCLRHVYAQGPQGAAGDIKVLAGAWLVPSLLQEVCEGQKAVVADAHEGSAGPSGSDPEGSASGALGVSDEGIVETSPPPGTALPPAGATASADEVAPPPALAPRVVAAETAADAEARVGANGRPTPAAPLVGAVACPVVVFQGDLDDSVPPCHAEWWSRRLPQLELVMLPGRGHVTALLGNSERVLAWIREA